MKEDELITDLFRAYFDARKNKRNTINQIKFEIDYEKNLIELCEDIKNRSYHISPSICFISEKPVKREIFAADFRDRVVHHLLFNYISPVFEQIFIDDSYSCRKGKGTMYGIRRIENFIYECSRAYTSDCYILKLDIHGYFMSIDKDILYRQLDCFISEAARNTAGNDFPETDTDLVMYLIEKVLSDDPTLNCRVKGRRNDWQGLPPSKSLFHSGYNCGLPIGNLTSQLFSNVYLHPLDCFVKNTLAMPYYGRYVDDFAIIHPDKEKLKKVIGQISEFLKDRLCLNLHPKKIYLQDYSKGVNFLGAAIKPYRTYISRRTKQNFISCIHSLNKKLSHREPSKSELAEMRAKINSYLGIMSHYYTYNIRKKYLLERENLLFNYGYLTTGLRNYVLKKEYR